MGGIKDLKDGVGRFSDYNDALLAVANMDSIDWWQIVRIKDDELYIIAEGVRS